MDRHHSGEHFYTALNGEKNYLSSIGWNYEGTGWIAPTRSNAPVYSLYNPNAIASSHNYTTSIAENNFLVSVGWQEEGIAWVRIRAIRNESLTLQGTIVTASQPSTDLNADSTPVCVSREVNIRL